MLNHLQSKQAAYVSDLKLNRKVVYAGQEQKLQDVARQMALSQILRRGP